jgi:hypothetical protein
VDALTPRVARLEARQELRHFGFAQISRVPLAVIYDVASDPADIRFLGPLAVVPETYLLSHDIEELRW